MNILILMIYEDIIQYNIGEFMTIIFNIENIEKKIFFCEFLKLFILSYNCDKYEICENGIQIEFLTNKSKIVFNSTNYKNNYIYRLSDNIYKCNICEYKYKCNYIDKLFNNDYIIKKINEKLKYLNLIENIIKMKELNVNKDIKYHYINKGNKTKNNLQILNNINDKSIKNTIEFICEIFNDNYLKTFFDKNNIDKLKDIIDEILYDKKINIINNKNKILNTFLLYYKLSVIYYNIYRDFIYYKICLNFIINKKYCPTHYIFNKIFKSETKIKHHDSDIFKESISFEYNKNLEIKLKNMISENKNYSKNKNDDIKLSECFMLAKNEKDIWNLFPYELNNESYIYNNEKLLNFIDVKINIKTYNIGFENLKKINNIINCES